MFLKQVIDFHFVHRVRFRLLLKFLINYFVSGTIYDLHINTFKTWKNINFRWTIFWWLIQYNYFTFSFCIATWYINHCRLQFVNTIVSQTTPLLVWYIIFKYISCTYWFPDMTSVFHLIETYPWNVTSMKTCKCSENWNLNYVLCEDRSST